LELKPLSKFKTWQAFSGIKSAILTRGLHPQRQFLSSLGAVNLNGIFEHMTNTKLFVGNLSFKTTEAELEETFSKSGVVVSVAIPTDRETGRKRGFGFVEMETKEMADAAVKEFNGQSIDGRQIVVNESKPREAAPRRGSW
jgi:cold-inducible RNA-binding protein